AAERAAADEAVRNARVDVDRQHRDLRSHVEGAMRRQREGARKAKQAGLPPIVAGAKKRSSQESQARVTRVHEQRLAQARERLEEAANAADRDREIRVELPDTAVPGQRDVAYLDACVLATGARVD